MRGTRVVAVLAALMVLGAVAGVGGDGGVAVAGAKNRPIKGQRGVVHAPGGKVLRNSKAKGIGHLTGFGSIEPTLGINKKGNIFVTATGSSLGPVLAESRDGGRTWRDSSPRLPGGVKDHVVTLDPYVYVDESTNRIFNIDLTVACSYLSFSDDGGATWVSNPLACGRPVNDHQTLFSGPPAVSPMSPLYEEVVYYCWNDFGAGTSCSKSLDGGITWAHTGQAFLGVSTEEGQGGQLCGGFNGHGVVGNDGTVYLPKEYCGQPWLGISKDEGLTWQKVQVAKNTTEFLGSDTSISVDRKGNLYYVYETAKQELYLVTSTNGGKRWSKPMMIGAPGVEEVTLPTIDGGDPGRIAVAYMGTKNSPFDRCNQECSDQDYAKSEWNGYVTYSTNALAKRPTFTSVAINPKDDPLVRGRCDFNNRCGPVLDFIDVEVAPNGTPWAAFADACYGPLAKGGGPCLMGDGIGLMGRVAGAPRLR